jgi:sugar phosphate isomerase/epimerase
MEANPPVYHTNYINDTASALELIEKVGSNGFKLNLDVGTMIQNHESLDELKGKGKLIHHVHISEPGLKPIEKRTFHKELKTLLDAENYQGFISIEMGKTDDMNIVENAMEYVKEVFH